MKTQIECAGENCPICASGKEAKKTYSLPYWLQGHDSKIDPPDGYVQLSEKTFNSLKKEVKQMASRIIVQPDKLYARFSEIVDDFTHMNMSREEAVEVCQQSIGMGKLEAEEKVKRAELDPSRWEQALQDIQIVHGKDVRKKRELYQTE